MRNEPEYRLTLPHAPDEPIAARVFDLAWRFDFDAPGFCLLDVGIVDSHTLRSWLVILKQGLSALSGARGGKPFRFASLARFDQQVTTKFHLDGAPAESLLILGYEASNVVSRLFLADYTRAAFDLRMTPQQFLEDCNPMYKKGEELLGPYVTELPQPARGDSRILVINNSSLPFTPARTHPLGVMHKAIIATPDETERRVVNSTMLVTDGESDAGQPQEFVRTDEISRKNY